MTDDLKERLRAKRTAVGFCSPEPGVIETVYGDDQLTTDDLAYITNLESRLAAAVEVQDRLMSERYQQYLRAEAAEANVNRLQEGEARLSLLLNETAQARDAAEAGEDALADCIRDFLHETGAYRPHERKAMTALAAYEARRR